MTATTRASAPVSERAPFGAVVAWTAILLLALYTVGLGGGWSGIYATGIRAISIALAAAGLAAWGVLAIRHPDWRRGSVIWPVLVLPLASLALSTALSPTPRLGVEYVAWSVILVALYLFLVNLLGHGYARARIGGLAAVLGLVLGVWYVVEVGTAWLDFWSLVGRVVPPPLRPGFAALTLGNPSAVLTVTVLLWIAAFAGLGTATGARRAILSIQGALTLFAVVVSGSRAGWLAIGIAAAVVGLCWLLAPGHRGGLGRALGDRRVRIGLVGAGVVGALVAAVVLPGIAFRAGSGGEALRGQFLMVAVRQFQDAPLVGRGPGTWVAERIARTTAEETDYYIPHAHNVYAQTAGELGLVGLAVGVTVVAIVGWLVLGGIRDADPDRRRWGWAAFLALAYLAAHQLLDFYPNMPAAMLPAAIPVALLDATAARSVLRVAVGERGRGVVAVIVAIAVGLSVAGLAVAERTATTEQQAVDLANEGDWAAALPLARHAAAADPAWPPYQMTAGLAEASTGDPDAAAVAIRRAAEVSDLPQAWLDVAALAADAGQQAEAREALGRALRLGVQQPAVAYAAGRLFDLLGDAAAADDAYVRALLGVPSLAGDPSWSDATADPDLAARWPALLERAMTEAPESAWQFALVTGDTAQALALAASAPDPELTQTIIAAWDGDERALAEMDERVQDAPLDVSLLGWAARLHARAGDETEADRYRAWSEYVNGGSSAAGHEVRVGSADDAREGEARAGNLTSLWGHYTYRRPTPWDLLVPSPPRLVYE